MERRKKKKEKIKGERENRIPKTSNYEIYQQQPFPGYAGICRKTV